MYEIFHTMSAMKKPRLLRALRAEQEPKMNQRQMARRAEALLAKGQTMSPARYWQIENGEGSEPSADERQAVATALGVKPSEIAWPEFSNERAS